MWLNITMANLSSNRYVDLDLRFARHPITNDVVLVRGEQAVRRAVINLIRVKYYSVAFKPELGSGVAGLLSEFMSPVLQIITEDEIRTLIKNWEPRAEIVSLQIGNRSRNVISVNIHLRVVGLPNPVVIDTILKRAR